MIDIFPYSDHVIPSLHKIIHGLHNRINRYYLVGKHKRLADILYLICFKIFKPIANLIGLLFSKKTIYAHDYLSHNTYFRFQKDKIFPLKEIEFEGHYFNVPNNTDYFLKVLYGNYMDLPPITERNHHNYRFTL